ncbi:Transcription initiation factor TFIID subunit 4 [Liparis tanakae]|uniref:Transcription initiation factor TFIID subunit 4 n=1 Tax=Liparis tanakae TaxID=230148 RepID=A0A4Z2GZ20_9TELE|nr:Transcription initiation factor TFIID subunit 4 [Liparis tanakae]
MAGASDPLEDMLFTEVDEKAVSDLVGSLESQLGDRKASAAPFPAGNRDGTPSAAGQLSGKARDRAGSPEPQQGHPGAGSHPEPGADEPLSGRVFPSSGSAVPAGAVPPTAGAPPATNSPVPGPVTLPTRSPAAGFPRATGPVAEAVRTASPGLQSLNGGAGAVKLVNSVPAPGTGTVISTGGSAAAPPAVHLQRHPGAVAQNGLDPKGPPPAPQLPNHSTKVLLPSQTQGAPNPPGPAAAHTGTGTVAVTLKPAVNGVGPGAAMRPPGAPLVAAALQQQRAGLMTGLPRAAAPQPALAARPQQQTTIQLPPGFSMPPGMVLVRTETGQLVMVPQQVLAQAQAKTQQGQAVANIGQRPPTPTIGTTIRVSTAATAPQTVRLASPAQTRMVQPPSTTTVQKTITVSPGGVSVKMAAPQKAQTVITAGGKPGGVQATPPPTPAARVSVVSQEMQENVKKCKNFLATLIKLASHNSPSPDTSKNVKSLVQDLLDAKIEPEEFTSRLQAELKSSPQPYLIPFLKKSLPALRQSLLSNQQSLVNSGNLAPPPMAPPPMAAGCVAAAIRPRLPVSPAGVRLTTPLPTAVVNRAAVQRTPVVFSQTLRPQGTLIRGPSPIINKSHLNLAAQANQRKLSDPGGGTFRDDDDINDVASMAGVNLNEENARILATSSELVGTKIRSCKDEAFLPPGLLQRRLLDTARKLGVTEVPLEVVHLVSHATQARLRSLLENVSSVAQHRADGGKMQQQELALMRQRDANLTALAAIGPRRKRRMDSPGGSTPGPEVASGSGSGSSPVSSSRQQLRQRITRVNLRDFIFCLEQDRSTARSMTLYKALLK